ncbi:hypothetical protein C8J57DRAFT_1722914 [Mycena rebaudengoi]|nr:hypothetical protein C8J57DRAFT_1722914 [Mycena rebaudengoi]
MDPNNPTLHGDGYYTNLAPQHAHATQPSAIDLQAMVLENQRLAKMVEEMRLGFDGQVQSHVQSQVQSQMAAYQNSVQDDFFAVKAQRDAARAEIADTNARLEALERAKQPTRDPRVRPSTYTPSRATPPPSKSQAKGKSMPAAATPSKPRRSSAQSSAESPRSSATPPHASASKAPPSSRRQSTNRAGGSPTSASSKAKAGNTKKTRKPAEHQMFVGDIDSEAKTFKDTFIMHCRFISGNLDSASAPTSASPEAVKLFERRFEGLTVTELKRQGQIGQLIIKASEVKFGLSVRDAVKSKSKIMRGFCQVEEGAILHVKTYFAKLGLSVWAVDYTQTPYSMYNQAMRMAAIDTFRFLMGACSYDFLHPDTRYVNDSSLMVRIYDHHIHHAMFKKWTVEIRAPGGKPACCRAQQIFSSSYSASWLKDNKIVGRLRGMFVVKATSDTESNVALAREERSQAADQLVRKVDGLILQDLVDDGKTRAANLRKTRRVPPFGQREAGQFQAVRSFRLFIVSLLKKCVQIPKGMPIQYYDASWFNDRPPQARAKIAPKLIVAFPPGSTDFFSRRGDNTLSVEQLTAKYGATVFGDYDLDFEPAVSTAGVDADDEGEGDVVGSEDSEEEGESSDARSAGSFINDAGASEGEQDDAMYEEEEDVGDAQTSDDGGATAGNQASFAAAFDVDMENTEREIFGSGSDSDD